jgi:hypothetical protein
MAQRLPALRGADFDPASAGAAGRLDDYVRTKHAGDAESIDCTDGVKFPAAKLYAVLCLLPGERVSISNRAGQLIHSDEVMRLQLGNEHLEIFYGEAGLFANFVQMRRPARSRKKLKNRSPHVVLFWLKSLIPFFGKTQARVIAPEQGSRAAGLVNTDQSGR